MGTVDRAGLIDLWEDIQQDESFDHLRLPGINLVPGVGPDHPKAMLVGEAPGAQENNKKRPFEGAAGAVLAQLMSVSRLSTDTNSWLTNVIKYRPPLNRTPTPDEIADAQPYLRREWSLVGRPPILVAVGATGWRAMGLGMADRTPLSKVVGEPIDIAGGIVLWPMFHPAFGMRNKSMRPKMQEHWESLGQWLRERYSNEFSPQRGRRLPAGKVRTRKQ